ncbi:hypothetical protein I317_07518 [Kwoniella heveanensis CBS 569]|nr:hypothetical protein I317_07518 [Kwoniella heveanensis CBS 569]
MSIRAGFQTDTDISRSSGLAERELKPWVPDAPLPNGPQSNGAGGRDADTFGSMASNIPWDQFETNERLFGAKTNFQEELYTTKLNKTGADYKKREKEADRLAAEIMGTTVKNSHVLEERNQASEDSTKDEEEKYSGVVRAPGAYVPPGARRAAGMGVATPRVSAPAAPASTATPAKVNGSTSLSPAPQPVKALSPEPTPSATISPPPGPARSTSDDPASTLAAAVASVTIAEPAPETQAAGVAGENKTDGQFGGVLNEWRQFVGTEREKVEAKKMAAIKSERERQLAELKKFHANFKVPLPMPKDILPILSKDELKQKDIEAKAASALESAREAQARKAEGVRSPAKASAPMEAAKTDVPKVSAAPKKPFMKIPEIPPFNPSKRKSLAPSIPVPETAPQNIPVIAASPTPSNNSLASASQQAKLNPKANTFVFKPNPGAAVFKPGGAGQSSASPAQSSRPLPAQTPSVVASPAPAAATAAPAVPKNPFFKDKVPERITVDPRTDFNPWKHGSGSVPSASTIGLQWPYSGRKSHVPHFGAVPLGVNGPVHGSVFEEDGSPSPHMAPAPLVPGMPPNYPPYGYRFSQPGLPPHAIPGQISSPMFSPGPQFAPLPGQTIGQQPPQHLGPGPGGPQPNGMPIYFQGGMPPNSQFIPPQHMQFNPHTHNQQRHGPGPGGHGVGVGPGGPGMYYPPNTVTTPHQTPQLQHNLPFPSQPPPPQGQAPYGGGPGGPGGPHHPQHSPMQVNHPHPGSGAGLGTPGSGPLGTTAG